LAASPCARNSAIWLSKKSPGGNSMMVKTSAEMTISVGTMAAIRQRMYLSIDQASLNQKLSGM
jgi:hypothetical protein